MNKFMNKSGSFIADLQAVTNVRDLLDKFSAASAETIHTL